MSDCMKFYIDGAWVEPAAANAADVVNPATETAFARVALGSAEDVDRAVKAAMRAFVSYSRSTREERVALLERIIRSYSARAEDLARAVTAEMGAPLAFARSAQVPSGLVQFEAMVGVLKHYRFERHHGKGVIVREPIGVCGFITPWNWPLNQICCKVAPALAAGCTIVLKPSEMTPISAQILAEVLHDARVPPGVFNLVQGDGPVVGQAIAAHPSVDMVSFTGSTRVGVLVAKAAADTVKRVTQELGGKSANVILADADFERAVTAGVKGCFSNAGQSCDAPTRMLVPRARHDEAVGIATAAAQAIRIGDPLCETTTMGPVVSQAQFERIQRLIRRGIDEGAQLAIGGVGRPDNLPKGYYVRPTLLANVDNAATVAREEIFGPVLSILPYEGEEDAIRIANDTVYGLSSYVWAGTLDHARAVGARMRAGNVHLNGGGWDPTAPFGGYKRSGNGRECGELGFEEFLEVKAMLGCRPD